MWCAGLAPQTSRRHVACAVVHCAGLSVGALAQRLGQAAGARCVAYAIAYRAVLSGVHWLSVTDKRQARETCCLCRCPLRGLERGCTGSAQRLGQAAGVTWVAYAVAYRAVLSWVHWLSVTTTHARARRHMRETCCLRRCLLRGLEHCCTALL